jgi:hypothetical protein
MPDSDTMRAAMVERQIAARGVTDRRVLAAMRDVPREAFVPALDQREQPPHFRRRARHWLARLGLGLGAPRAARLSGVRLFAGPLGQLLRRVEGGGPER